MIKNIVQTERAPAAIGPYSQAVRAGDLLFCSGQIPLDPVTGDLIVDSIAAATERVLKNLGAVLDASGASFSDVVKTTIYLTDINDFATVNEVYARYFDKQPPARACIQVAHLPKDVQIEIEAIAYLPAAEKTP